MVVQHATTRLCGSPQLGRQVTGDAIHTRSAIQVAVPVVPSRRSASENRIGRQFRKREIITTRRRRLFEWGEYRGSTRFGRRRCCQLQVVPHLMQRDPRPKRNR